MLFDFFNGAWQGVLATSGLELVAVLCSITYLILAMRESQWCWPFAFVGTAIYVYLFWTVFLFMDSVLHVYYLGMAVYGWFAWRKRNRSETETEKNEDENTGLKIQTWPLKYHIIAIVSVVVASSISGYFLSQHSQAAWPYVDSFTTWASVLTTYMVAQKVLENWIYWFVIDAVASVLYIERGLYFTSLLFMAYVVIVVIGYFNWRKRMTTE